LQKVEDGVAWVSFDTQVLTPVDDPRIESQLIQQLSRGVIQFDLQRGQMLAKHLSWNRRCLGFRGPESSLNYVAKYVFSQLETAAATSGTVARLKTREHLQPEIRLTDDSPIFRW
jgi:hypothetical protein